MAPTQVTLAQAGCSFGGPVSYDWLMIREYRSYKSGANTVLEMREYPSPTGSNEWSNSAGSYPATAPAWNTGWATVRSNFNGVMYVNNDDIPAMGGPWRWIDTTNSTTRAATNVPDRAPPAVASFSKLNIVASGSVSVYSDLKYEKPLCYAGNSKESFPQRDTSGNVITANCDDPNDPNVKDNILGIYTAGTNKNITFWPYWDNGQTIPNMTIHGVLMAANGVVNVGNATSSPCPAELNGGRGSIRLLGGIIQNNYGAFGQSNSTGGIGCGYGRSFTYDKRMKNPAIKPPSFPTASAATSWGLKIYRTDDPDNQINTNDPNNPASTVNVPLPISKGARRTK
jgi:hypothetical protein